MRPLGAAQLLATWERGRDQHPIDRALSMLQSAEPHRHRSELNQLSLGVRDALLFGFYEANFGDQLEAFESCQRCATELTIALPIRGFADFSEPDELPDLEVDGWTARYRLPNSIDLAAAVADAPDVTRMRQVLLTRCITRLQCGEEQLDPQSTTLPKALTTAIGEHLETAQGPADISISLVCPDCGHSQTRFLDIASFAWRRIELVARRLLTEVHLLASSYGWTESQTLAVSPTRRQFYLSMIGVGAV